MKAFVVAIDGPAGAGKSATARAVARTLALPHVDSGAMYRAAAWVALQAGADLDSEAEMLRALEGVRFEPTPEGLRCGGRLLDGEIRTAEAGDAASRVAVHPGLRRRLVAIQRSFARPPGVVMEGRDIGTVVFPRADLKIFLEASAAVRALRRFRELEARGERPDLAAIEAMIRERDGRDQGRAESPLQPAEDAIRLDTSDLGLAEQVEVVTRWAELARRGPGPTRPFYWFGSRFVKRFSRTFLKFRIEGLDHVPRSGPLIAACNHISFWDPPLVGSNFPRVLHFVAKAELFQNKVFGAMLRGYNSIPIQRGTRARSGLLGAEEVLNGGGAVLIFPEGTRNKSGALLAPRAGIGRLAVVTRSPVLPIRISGSNQIRRSLRRQTLVRIVIGTPMTPPIRVEADRESMNTFAAAVMEAIAALPG
ncbi:MAG TPA: (d)CMP kinase [Candidatus Binatia bacterium]|nr:(d)CMP kinase [Candidatus Binatia bacterium]